MAFLFLWDQPTLTRPLSLTSSQVNKEILAENTDLINKMRREIDSLWSVNILTLYAYCFF